jgi:UDP-N-acetyl-D-mannosaminuronate dehydrogenase
LALALLDAGIAVEFHDPSVEEWRVGERLIRRVLDLQRAVEQSDLVVLVQNHSAYDVDAIAEGAGCFFDTRGVTTSPRAHRL